MAEDQPGSLWWAIVPLAMLAIAVLGIVEEAHFRSESLRTHAVVRDWRSDRLGGLRGTAVADVALEGHPLLPKQAIRTQLWYRPSEGSRIAVFFHPEKAVGRVDGFVQGYLLPAFLLPIALGWLLEIWWLRRRAPARPSGSA